MWYGIDELEGFRVECARHKMVGAGDLVARPEGMPAGSYLMYSRVEDFPGKYMLEWDGKLDGGFDRMIHYTKEAMSGWHFMYVIPMLGWDECSEDSDFGYSYYPEVNRTCICHHDFGVFVEKLQDYFEALLGHSAEVYGWKSEEVEEIGTVCGVKILGSSEYGCLIAVKDGRVAFDSMVEVGETLTGYDEVSVSEVFGVIHIHFGRSPIDDDIELRLDPETFDILNYSGTLKWVNADIGS